MLWDCRAHGLRRSKCCLWHLSDPALTPRYLHSHPNGSRCDPTVPPPVEGPRSLTVNTSPAASRFQGPSLGNVDAVSWSTRWMMAFPDIYFHFKFTGLSCTQLLVPPHTCRVAGWEVAVSSPNKAHPEILLMKICSCSWDLATACEGW